MTATDAERHGPVTDLPLGSWWRAVLLLLAAGLAVCHGCHGDEDNELAVPFFRTPRPVQEKDAGHGHGVQGRGTSMGAGTANRPMGS